MCGCGCGKLIHKYTKPKGKEGDKDEKSDK